MSCSSLWRGRLNRRTNKAPVKKRLEASTARSVELALETFRLAAGTAFRLYLRCRERKHLLRWAVARSQPLMSREESAGQGAEKRRKGRDRSRPRLVGGAAAVLGSNRDARLAGE